jgi:hypothetical protein
MKALLTIDDPNDLYDIFVTKLRRDDRSILREAKV